MNQSRGILSIPFCVIKRKKFFRGKRRRKGRVLSPANQQTTPPPLFFCSVRKSEKRRGNRGRLPKPDVCWFPSLFSRVYIVNGLEWCKSLVNNGISTNKTDSVSNAGKGAFPGIRDGGPVTGRTGRRMVPEWLGSISEVNGVATTYESSFNDLRHGANWFNSTDGKRRSQCALSGYAVCTFRIRRVHFPDTSPRAAVAVCTFRIRRPCRRVHFPDTVTVYALFGYGIASIFAALSRQPQGGRGSAARAVAPII